MAKRTGKNATKTARDWNTTLARIQQAIEDDGPRDGQKFEVGKCYKIDGKNEKGSYATKRHYSFWIEKTAQGGFRIAITGLNTAVWGEEKGGNCYTGSFKNGKLHSVYFEVKDGAVQPGSIQQAVLVKAKTMHKVHRKLSNYDPEVDPMHNYTQKVKQGVKLLHDGERAMQLGSGIADSAAATHTLPVIAAPMILEETEPRYGQVIYPGCSQMLDKVIQQRGAQLTPEVRSFIQSRMRYSVRCLQATDKNWFHNDIKLSNFVVLLDAKGNIIDVRITDWDALSDKRDGASDFFTQEYLPHCLSPDNHQIIWSSLSRDAYALMLSAIQVEVGDAQFGLIEGSWEGSTLHGFDFETKAHWIGLLSGVNAIISKNHPVDNLDKHASEWIIGLTKYLIGDEDISKGSIERRAEVLLGASQSEIDISSLMKSIEGVKAAICARKAPREQEQSELVSVTITQEDLEKIYRKPGNSSFNPSTAEEVRSKAGGKGHQQPVPRREYSAGKNFAGGIVAIGLGVALEICKKLLSKYSAKGGAILMILGMILVVRALCISIAKTCGSSQGNRQQKTK